MVLLVSCMVLSTSAKLAAPAALEFSQCQPLVTQDGQPASPATQFQVGYDRSALYFRFDCQEPAMAQLVRNATHNDLGDDQPWEDDCIELFLGPNAEDKSVIYHFIITAGNVLWDARALGVLTSDLSWNSAARTEVTYGEGNWTLQVAIPVDALGITDPNFAPDLLLQVYRTRRAGGNMQSFAWRPTGIDTYYQPDSFGVLRLAR